MSSSLAKELKRNNGLHEVVVGPFKPMRRFRVSRRPGMTKPAVKGVHIKRCTNMVGLQSH